MKWHGCVRVENASGNSCCQMSRTGFEIQRNREGRSDFPFHGDESSSGMRRKYIFNTVCNRYMKMQLRIQLNICIRGNIDYIFRFICFNLISYNNREINSLSYLFLRFIKHAREDERIYVSYLSQFLYNILEPKMWRRLYSWKPG